jgi:hypothetical protein
MFAAILIAGGVAYAADDCLECEDNSLAPLVQSGWNLEDVEVLMVWRESTPSGAVVDGFRLQPKAGGDAFDVYVDENGQTLSDSGAGKLGIRPKRWDLPAAEAAADPPTHLALLRPTRRAPVTARAAIPRAHVDVPDVDIAALEHEDARLLPGRMLKSQLRVGVFVAMPEPIEVIAGTPSAGEWGEAEGLHVWAVELNAADAVGLRLHFSDLHLPENVQLTIYNAEEPTEAYGPFTESDLAATGYWTPSCFSERVVLELVMPTQADRREVSLKLEEVIYIYRPLIDPALKSLITPLAGDCNLDVNCYPDWETEASAVGRLSAVVGIGLVLCTSVLVADTYPDPTPPYLLTAFHCVDTPAKAATVEVYWLYETASCNGAVPNLGTVPRTTGGADFLVGTDTYTSTDITLLRLRQAPPAYLPRAGWSGSAVGLHAPVVVIHHPGGEYKRISFGETVASTSSMHAVVWSAGTTEPGSSGSPLLRDSTQQIIGLLSSGLAACGNQLQDEFGRLDKTWPLLVPYLGGDNDGDGLLDENEVTGAYGYTLNPTNADTDEDGLGDGDEVFGVHGYFSDPTNPDTDSDDLSDGDEVLGVHGYFTDPLIPDTDADGLSDGDEVFGVHGYFSNPTNPDTDGDGLSDYAEIDGTFGYLTNPANADTDGDKLGDYLEIALGLNPLDPFDAQEIPSLTAPWFEPVGR